MSARAIRSAQVAAASARLSYFALRSRPPGGPQTWNRTNHRGEPVTLLAGPAAAIGGIAGALAGPGTARERAAMAVAGAGAGACGIYDDLSGNEANRGLRGHLGALLKGELTTGSVKLAGIGATGLAAALVAGSDAQSGPGAVADTVINAGLIAGGANLLNLFDLRPGRAIKVAAIAAALVTPAGGGGASAAPAAAAAALLPEDLGERAMLGDGGANALGAMLATAAATSLSRPARIAALGVVAGLTVASEYVSFTKVIERTGPLRTLDMLGRRPAAAPDATPGGEPTGASTAGTEQARDHPAPHLAMPAQPGTTEDLHSAEAR